MAEVDWSAIGRCREKQQWVCVRLHDPKAEVHVGTTLYFSRAERAQTRYSDLLPEKRWRSGSLRLGRTTARAVAAVTVAAEVSAWARRRPIFSRQL